MTGIDLSKYSTTELELIKGIFEHEYDVKDIDGVLVAIPTKAKNKGGQQNG